MGLWVGLTTLKVTADTLSFFIGWKEINLDSNIFFFPGQLFVAVELWHMEFLSCLHLARGHQGLYNQLSKPSVLCMEILVHRAIKENF